MFLPRERERERERRERERERGKREREREREREYKYTVSRLMFLGHNVVCRHFKSQKQAPNVTDILLIVETSRIHKN